MSERVASCFCGQLKATCSGEPFRISVCHCLNCQQRSGSAFAVQARFQEHEVVFRGEAKQWVRVGDAGEPTTFHFCPSCGSTVAYQGGGFPDAIAVPVGAFADPSFPTPFFSVWEVRKHGWVDIVGEGIEHFD